MKMDNEKFISATMENPLATPGKFQIYFLAGAEFPAVFDRRIS
jgi:hypothetical protein